MVVGLVVMVEVIVATIADSAADAIPDKRLPWAIQTM